jgi:hypothetical protein
MQRPIESTQGFLNFGLPLPQNEPEIMTHDQFDQYVKQAFNLENEPSFQTQPFNYKYFQQQPSRDTFGQIKVQPQPQPQQHPLILGTKPIQSTQLPPPPQHIRGPCGGATGPNQPSMTFGDAMSNFKKEKDKKDILDSLYAELSSIRTQIEVLTKTTDNIYRIINKL